jgi:homocysteine S-methyltransferase
LYEDNPGYFAEKLLEMKRLGVRALGGCCGTTPEHIRRAAALCEGETLSIPAEARAQAKPQTPVSVSPLAEKLSRGPVALVEVDPPVDADAGHLMDAARRLKDAGADALTLADAPLARARADSLMMASLVIREAGIDAIPHLTCRDRTASRCAARCWPRTRWGARRSGGHRRPIPGAAHGPDESAADKGVFNFNSFTLIDFIRGMNQGPFQKAPMFILAALNIGAQNFEAELRRAEKKLERGANAFVTQSIFTTEGVRNLRRARETLGAPVIAGIMPVASHRNAVFLNSEVPGVKIPKAFVDSLEGRPGCGDRTHARVLPRIDGGGAAHQRRLQPDDAPEAGRSCGGVITHSQRGKLKC